MKRQPKAGDLALHCGHVMPEVTEAVHWYESPDDTLTLPEQNNAIVSWVIICFACHAKGIDAMKMLEDELVGGGFELTQDHTIKEIH